MWEREVGFCENCHHDRPKISDCIDCYVEKLTSKSHDFMINRKKVDSEEATRLASYLQQLGISFHGKMKKSTVQ